jgi:hypothetical protein
MTAPRILTAALSLLLVGCVTSDPPKSSDFVKGTAQAIEIGRAECDARRFRPDLAWRAELHGGIWDVWVGDRKCRSIGTKVIAANGKIAEKCMMCVVVA